MVLQIGFVVVDTHHDQLFPRSEFAWLLAICVKARAATWLGQTKFGPFIRQAQLLTSHTQRLRSLATA